MRQWVKRMFLFVSVILFLGVSACTTSKPSASPAPPPVLDQISTGPPKNVIFLIGDGMGLPQITGAMYMNNNYTVFERFKNIGFHKSHASDNLVTDSAAGATAFASGVKTYNGAIGVDAKKQPVPTLLEMAEKKGMATGMVATSSITHATPAAFIAHVTGREQQDAIALGFLDTEIDLFIGGGLDDFARRVDQRNLVGELEAKGYDIRDFFDTPIENFNFNTPKNIGYFTANGEPLPASQGRDYFAVATQKSLEFLNERSPQGFFLMIEGSQIDWGGHSNDANYVVSELLEFEKIIAQVLDFAEKEGNTLVVVTADHETGGFAVNPGSKLNDIIVAFTTKSHTALMIPVFAKGPGEELFRGIYENTDIHYKLKTLMNLQ
jgi:alkaline phosphatase